MKVTVELVDAFEPIEIDVPEQVVPWFTREAASKGMTMAELLSSKTAGLTVAQLVAARTRMPAEQYVLRWIINQRHEIVAKGGIPRG